MATPSLNPSCNALRDNASTQTGTPPSKTGLADDELEWKRLLEASIWRCDSVCIQRRRTPVRDSPPQSMSWPHIAFIQKISQNVTKAELLDLAQYTVVEPPPPYTSTVADAPPCYHTLQFPQQLPVPQHYSTRHVQHRCQAQSRAKLLVPPPPIYSMKPVEIDFDDSSTFRQAKGKGGAKKAQKQADQAKWADDGGNGANEGGNAGDNAGGAGGGGGGGSNNGDGGAGDDGGGWDDWATGGGKKNKKKGKKGKNEEEDEEKEKDEEEKKNKEANGGAGANDLSWMDDTVAKPDDEWGGFTAAEKKGKKNKKGKADVVPEPTYNAFEDINLGGDTPQLDLNFGTDTATKGFSSGGFGAGGFGSSFDTGNTWGFSGLGNGATNITDSINDTSGAADDGGGWGFGKKTKKTTTTSGFDFGNLATLDEGGEAQANAGGDQDDWATGFTATSKKNSKKSKKGGIGEASTAADATTIGTAVTDLTPADDSWSAWGTSSAKKDKNKKKKNEPEPNDVPPMPPPPPPPPPPNPEEPPTEDTWSSFGGAKSKKKNKKGAAGEPVTIGEPIVVVPEPEPEADAGWSSFGTKKDKKKGKKDATEDKKAVPDPVVVVGDVEAETKPEDSFDWGLPSKKDKDKKKGKKGVEEDTSKEPAIVEVPEKSDNLDLDWDGLGVTKDKKKKATSKVGEPAITAVPDPEPEAGAGWGGFGVKKEKKRGKKATEEVEPQDDDIVGIVEDDDPVSGAGWGAFGTKKDKDKKKSKAGATEDFNDNSHVIDVPNIEPIVEDSLDTSWGTTAPKKGKKDKKGAITEVKEDVKSAIGSAAAAEAAAKVADDDFMGWGGGSTDKKKDKKGKKGAAEAKKEETLPPPPPPPPVPIPEEPAFTDTFGSAKKDKKGKKGKMIGPEPAIIEVPDFPAASQEEAPQEDWGNFGLSAKDKKKKEKEKEKEKEKKDKEKEEKAKKEQEELDREEMEESEWLEKEEKEEAEWLEKEEKEEAERLEKEEKEKGKEKIKPGKKGKAGTATASSKTKDLMAGSVPDAAPAVEDDFSINMWGSTKKDSKKKSSKKDSAFEVPPPVPTPPAQGFTPPPEDALDDLLGDDWGNFGAGNDKSKKTSKADESKPGKTTTKGKADEEKAQVETAAKAAKSFWGGMTSTAAPSKSKPTKEKTSDKDKKEVDVVVDEDLDMDEIVNIIEEEPPPKKGSKSKTPDSKLAKTSSKEEKSSKSSASDKKAKADAEMNALIDLDDFEAKDSKDMTAEAAKTKDEDKKADSSWGFWGSSKKPSGKKGDEPKKEINKQEATNHSDPLAFLSNGPEPSLVADEPAQSQPAKSSKSAMSASKTSAKLSVAQKIKALEEEKKVLEPPAPPPPPAVEIEPPAKKTSAANNSRTRGIIPSKAASASKKKDLSPPAEEEKKKSKDSVPGGFPDDEENLIDMLASSSPVEKKSDKKDAKTVKQEPANDMMDVDVPVVPAAPPTPPAEPTPAKPVKKERARVVRDQGASSWGFWGAAPKKDDKKGAKAKDDADVPPTKKTAAPALARSKSTKTPKEKDKDIEKSSSSDTKEKKAESRPAKSRGSSFGAFFGAPPPARAKPTRRVSTSAASKTTSKRQSMDVDAFGLPSPPPEDSPAAFGKAAKVMGTTSGKLDRKASTKGKQKAPIVPDPYPIDDDDMVMVNNLEDPIVNAPIPRASKSGKEKNSKSKSMREPKPATDGMDDVVMVDGPSLDEPEPLAFDEKPRAPAPLQRSATSARKPQGGKLMGIFGGFGKTRGNSDSVERPKSKAAVTDDEALSPRKRTVTGREDSSKRIRRDDRKVHRSDKTDRETEGFVTDAPNDGGAATELDDPEIRRQERRAKRDAREPDNRRAHRRGVGKEASEEPRKAKASERRPRREDERPPKESSDRANHSSSRPRQSERRRSYMEPPSAGDRPKVHRSRTEQSSKKRHSVAVDGGVGDYFDPRNAAAEGAKDNEPYMHGANDHTSSWVKSQLSDPADPPPVEGTVIEPTPELGGKGGYAKDDDEARRAARKARRRSRYGPEDEVGETDRERRRRRKDKGSEESAAEWGGKEREKLSRRYTDMGGVRLDSGRPSLGAAGKRGSWLKKVTGLGMG